MSLRLEKYSDVCEITSVKYEFTLILTVDPNEEEVMRQRSMFFVSLVDSVVEVKVRGLPSMSNKQQGVNIMICDICGESGVRQRYISRSYGQGEALLVIEGVPVMSCSQCGESYLTAQTLHEIERIKHQREGITVKRPVAVAVFS